MILKDKSRFFRMSLECEIYKTHSIILSEQILQNKKGRIQWESKAELTKWQCQLAKIAKKETTQQSKTKKITRKEWSLANIALLVKNTPIIRKLNRSQESIDAQKLCYLCQASKHLNLPASTSAFSSVGRTSVSKTGCRGFKSFRARFN